MSLRHDLPYLTARIDVRTKNNQCAIGTGFFCGLDIVPNDANGHKLMLISNKHVLHGSENISESDIKVIIHLNRKKDNGMPDLGNIKSFNLGNFEYRYYPHPNPDIDLACFDVTSILSKNVHFKHIDKGHLNPIDYRNVAPGSQVIFAGYPEDRYDVLNNLPLIRTGTIASMPDVDFNGRGQIIIDAQVFPGQSGSPVFVKSANNQPYFLGVICQTMIKNSQLQILPVIIPRVKVQQVIGLGIVIKQKHVNELIDYTTNKIRQLISK